MMRITGVEIAKKSKCAKQRANRKVLKHCQSYIHCVRHVGNNQNAQNKQQIEKF